MNSQHLNIMSLDFMSKDPSQGIESDWMLRLRQKKREVLEEEQEVHNNIKDYFSELTIQLQQLEQTTLAKYRNKLRDFFTQVDYFLTMDESQRMAHEMELCQIMEFNHKFHPNSQLLSLLTKQRCQFFQTPQEISFNATSVIPNHNLLEIQTTNKKNMGQLLIKQQYEEIIEGLEQQIEGLMIKQEKLIAKINQLQLKSKTKKVGKNYFPILNQEESDVSQLRLQRLQAQNKILIEQISQCSQKILSLRSQNSSILCRQGQSQIITTQKKRPNQVSRLQEQHSLQLYQSQIACLHEEIGQLKNTLAQQGSKYQQRYSKLVVEEEAKRQQLIKKIDQLADYSERLHSECQTNISIKFQLQQKLNDVSKQLQISNKQLKQQQVKFDDCKKLIELKDERISSLQNDLQIKCQQITQKQQHLKSTCTEAQKVQQINNTALKAKQLQVDSLKAIIKKQQTQISHLQNSLTQKEQAVYHFHQQMSTLQQQLTKTVKDRDSTMKKQISKAKKQIVKNFEQEKKRMMNDFGQKYGSMLQRVEGVSKEIKEFKDKYDSRLKVAENRMDILKAKIAFQMKQMFEKGSKPNNKDKIADVIKSYIESQSTLALKNSIIKQMKQEIATLKKQKKNNHKNIQRSATQTQATLELQFMEKSLWEQKMEVIKQCHQQQITQLQEMHDLNLRQKQQQLIDLKEKYNFQQKQLRQYKQIANESENAAQSKISKWKNKLQKQAQSEKKNESYLQSLKNNLQKTQQENQQLKKQVQTKRQLVQGLKKQVKEKDQEKTKLNEAMNGVIEENDRLKRQIKDAVRKQAVYQNFKDKLDDKKEIQSELEIIKKQMEDQQRILKAEINKKDSTIKQLRNNQELAHKKLKGLNDLQEQILDLKQKMRKLKSEIDRKDTLIQHMKTKTAKNESQMEGNMEKIQSESKKVAKQLQVEKNRLENCKNKLHKVESNAKILKIIIMKIFEKIQQKTCMNQQNLLSTQYQTKNTKYSNTLQKSPGRPDLSKYKQGLSILEISGQELGLGGYEMNPHSINACSPIIKKPMDNQLEDELVHQLEGNQVDCKAIVNIFSQML